ncbi:hypothetical protein IRY61_03150 [Candidatus Saccharibacteria bacterium]|nr:hypothetical protein [Candidatus Saccharibacteria bacterium]
MNEKINSALLRLTKRAETSDPKVLVNTFVDTGMLQTLLTSPDHQVIYGRRGTGKTHALLYLSETKRATGDITVYVDMRTIGSSVGLFADETIPLPERATRLLRDTLSTIHDRLYSIAIEHADRLNLSEVGKHLDALIEAATEVQVVGQTIDERASTLASEQEKQSSLGVLLGGDALGVNAIDSDKATLSNSLQRRVAQTGAMRHRVRFGPIGEALNRIAKSIAPHRIWLLLDEWSAVPIELQPYLADLIRRSILPACGVSVKIAAIEQRSCFQLPGERGDYTGIEIGADIAADLNLDDFMVFDHDSDRAVAFFRKLFFNHFQAVQKETNEDLGIRTEVDFVREAFTQRNALEEIVRAAEGVPRDAINVLGICAQKAAGNPMSVVHARSAAKVWYQRDKESAVSANADAYSLLRWIIDEVIAHRRARAFLVKSGTRDPLIDSLFDSRVLHVLKRNISAQDEPGARYDAFKIDYGCYVDLLTTAREPQGLLPAGNDASDDGAGYIEVPPDDYRAIRRAILDLSAFHNRTSGAP